MSDGKLCFIRRHWIKFSSGLLLAIVLVLTTLWGANRFREKEDRAEQIRLVILECTTPSSPGDPHPCFDDIQARNADRNSSTIRRAIELLAIDNDCRLRRTLWGMPAPEETDSDGALIPCPDQTPEHVYPGDGRPPPIR